MPRVRSSASSKPTRGCCDDNSDAHRTTPRASCSQSASVAGSFTRRSSKGLRSGFKQLCEDGSKHKGSNKETDDKGDKTAEPADRGSPVTAPDPLSRKSSEGLRWISKLGDEDTQLGETGKELGEPTHRGSEKELGNKVYEDTQLGEPGKELGEEAGTPTHRGSERELGNKQAEFRGQEKEPTTQTDDNRLEPMAAVSTGPEEPLTFRRGSALPSAPPSPINRHCLVIVCLSACTLFLLALLAIIMAYNRWTATLTLDSARTTDVNLQNRRQQLDYGIGDNSGCDNLFSFSHCAHSDMFG